MAIKIRDARMAEYPGKDSKINTKLDQIPFS